MGTRGGADSKRGKLKKKKDYSVKMQSKKVLLYVLHKSAMQET